MCLQAETYAYYGTSLDNVEHLNYQTSHKTSEMVAAAAQFAGQMALRLVHDHLVSLDVNRYSNVITMAVGRVYKRVYQLSQVSVCLTLFLFFKSSYKDLFL